MENKYTWAWVLGGGGVLLLTLVIFLMIPPRSTPRPPGQRPGQTGQQPGTVPGTTPGQTTPGTTPTPTPTPTPRTNAPFVITTMTHMEDEFTDDKEEKVFTKHVADLRWAMDLFDEYGAKLTIETGKPFAIANTTWDLNIMKEIVDRGHGVGSHGHFGNAGKDGTSQAALDADFVYYKGLVDALVGAENNQGMSTGFGPMDWVTGATKAGFHYMDGVTGFAYLSMAESVRPSGWTNSYILSTGYHDSIPPNLLDRIYPIPMKDAKDFVPDAGAQLTMMSGDIGELSSLAEGRSKCTPNCTLDQNDIDVVTADIDEILASRDTSRFAKINMHIPMNLLISKNETLLRSLLSAIKAYTDKKELSWDTQLGAYKQYISWGE